MKKLYLLTITSFLFLVGCNSATSKTTEDTENKIKVSTEQVSEFETAMKKGIEEIHDKKFDKALAAFELALEYETNNQEAKDLLNQVEKFQEILEQSKSESHEEIVKKIDGFLKTKNLNEDLKSYAEELKQVEDNSVVKEESIWNQDKATRLNEFMNSWGQTMGQSYKEYTPNNNVNFYGVEMPEDALSGRMLAALNNEPLDLAWSDTGSGEASHQLVAVYSDADTQRYLDKHLYFFIIHNGEPVVLVTQQNQGHPNNYLNMSKTQNADLNNGFSQIVLDGTEEVSTNNQVENENISWGDFIGEWYDARIDGDLPGFSFDETYYTDNKYGKKYKLENVSYGDDGRYWFSWDTQDFDERYGQGSSGPGPQAIVYRLVVKMRDGNVRGILIDQNDNKYFKRGE